jgi:UDP:flavonoid glycosyltransferase YjiC (YdhE family)
MTPTTWNIQCEEMIANVFSVHRPHTFVFDGAYPYRGMLNAIMGKNEISRVWVRRISKKKGDKTPVDAYDAFDKIVVPGDQLKPNMDTLASWAVEEINLIPPLLSVGKSDLLQRGTLRMKLGIPEDAKLALVILGAGAINDIEDLRRLVVESLVEEGAYVVVGDSMLNPDDPVFEHENVRVIQDYPIMRHRRCFDLAVIAGGYNSVHEALLLKLPSLIIPNLNTKRDNQVERALKAAELGGMMVIENSNPKLIKLAIQRLMNDSIRADLIAALMKVVLEDGAITLAESIINELS